MNDDFINIQIVDNFDHSCVVGWLKINKNILDRYGLNLVLSPALKMTECSSIIGEDGEISAITGEYDVLYFSAMDVSNHVNAIPEFTEREREILTLRSQGLSYKDIGKNFGVTWGRIRQIDIKAIKKVVERLLASNFKI